MPWYDEDKSTRNDHQLNNASHHSYDQKTKTKQKRNWPKIFMFIIVAALICLISLVLIYRNLTLQTTEMVYEDVDTVDYRNSDVNFIEQGQPISILLMGIDANDDTAESAGRSDVMILMTLNPETDKMTLVSIPRDTYTYIPIIGYYDKINHAYAYGGANAAIESVQVLFAIPVDYYISMNMDGLKELIDVIGGITLTPTLTFSSAGYEFHEGDPIHLDGEGAVAYVRNRKDDPKGDYGRQERQRQVIFVAIDEFISPSMIINYPSVLNVVEEIVKTNFSKDDLSHLVSSYRNTAKNRDQLQLTGSGQMINGVYYEIIPEEEIQMVSEILQEELQLSDELVKK